MSAPQGRTRAQSGEASLGGDAPPRYGELRDRIAAALEQAVAEKQVNAARLVRDLSSEIRVALARGLGYDGVARVFTRHGVPASTDAVRVALRRAGTPSSAQPSAVSAREPGRTLQVDAPSQPTDPDLQSEASSRENADVLTTPPRQPAIGRHLS